MAARKQLLGIVEPDAELLALMADRQKVAATEADLQEQRISYAYGNAMDADKITKDSVRMTSGLIRLRS